MYYDSVGFPISLYSVVLLNKHLYSVTGFDEAMTCSVKLQNGCIRSQAEPSELIVVGSVADIESVLRGNHE